jgi:hypothetical protein
MIDSNLGLNEPDMQRPYLLMGTMGIPVGVVCFFLIAKVVLSYTTQSAALTPLMFLAIIISLISLVLNVVALWKERQLRRAGAVVVSSFRLYAASAFISLAPLVIMIFLMICLGAAQMVGGARQY